MLRKKVILLASGGGTNAEALIKAMGAADFPADPMLVFSNVEGAGVLEKARKYGVATKVLPHQGFASREAFDAALLELLAPYQADFLCLAGYLRILTPAFVQAYPQRILNIHPSLLPKFGGPGMHGQLVHQAVLAAGETESGATVHFVDEGVDSGRILLQQSVPVLPTDTPASLAARILGIEHQLFAAALKKACLEG